MNTFTNRLAAFFIAALLPCHSLAVSDAEWVDHLKTLAADDVAHAQNELGELYAEGKIVSRDVMRARELFRDAAKQEHARAQYNYAFVLSAGWGGLEDDAEAVKWYLKSAFQGYDLAQFAVALHYFLGSGVPQNKIECLAWLNIAAIKGDEFVVKFKNSVAQEMGPDDINKAQKRSKKLLDKISRQSGRGI